MSDKGNVEENKVAPQAYSFKVIRKGNYKVRCVSLPSHKIVPLHQENIYTQIDGPVKSVNAFPQIWGCLISERTQKIQVKTEKSFNKFFRTQSEQHSYSPMKQRPSKTLLRKYTSRKRKLKLQDHSVLNEIEQKQKQRQGKKQGRISKVITECSSTQPTRYRYQQAQEMKEMIQQKSMQTFSKLSTMIKRRNKIINSLKNQIHSIRCSRMFRT